MSMSLSPPIFFFKNGPVKFSFDSAAVSVATKGLRSFIFFRMSLTYFRLWCRETHERKRVR